jgi:threonylcarbamoyladenosine tRNA methylthiotransferase MtaB
VISLPTFPTASKPGPRVRTYTFGCKVNLVDTAQIEKALERAAGARLVSDGSTPDVVVVNTCTVTAGADRQARQLIRRIHRENPAARVLVTGCYAESEPDLLRKMPGVEVVIPIREQQKIPRFLGFEDVSDEFSAESPKARTRAFLKLQDGCNAYCSFCILPYVRGRSRSVPLELLIQQARAFENSGYREIVVTGTHIGTYGRDLTPRLKFSDALRAIALAAPRTAIRVSSLEPMTLTPDVIRAVAENQQFRPHFHIPLQSGSNTVLRRMNRKYRAEHFAERVEKLYRTRPDLGLGTDVIVGYPGETDAEFEETRNLIESLPITFLHVFRFSARPGTKSAKMWDDVPPSLKRARSAELVALGERKQSLFFTSMVGKTVSVLVERKKRGPFHTGHSPQYVPVHFKGADRLFGNEVDVQLKSLNGFGMEGVILS